MTRRRTISAFSVIGALLAAYLVFAIDRSAGRVEQARDAEVTEQALTEVSDPLAALCAENPVIRVRVGAACDTAALVVSAPPGMPPAAGLAGRDGTDGRGITSTFLRDDGHLIITYTDGRQSDAGLVVGQTGRDGAGIVSALLVDRRLILTFTAGTTVDVGRVVGEPGRGVTSTEIADGRLVVTYSDGTAEDAGPVPPGPEGPPGRDAELPATVTRTYPDGTAETCTRAGGDDGAPVYDCTERV